MHAISCKVICIIWRLPCDFRGRLNRARSFDIGGEWRRACHPCEGDGIQGCELGGVSCIHALHCVAIHDTVFSPQILMLAVVMFVGFHDANAGNAHDIERTMMAAASETVEAVDHHNI